MFDLNVPWPVQQYAPASDAQIATVRNTIAMLYTLGYRYIALNFIAAESVKLPLTSARELNPIPIDELRRQLALFEGLRLFSRITLVVLDPAKTQSLLKLSAAACFDLIAVQPTTEKALQVAAANLDVDLISLPMATRLPFFLKHKCVGLALLRGVKFEVCYSGLVAGPAGCESLLALGTTAHLSRRTFFGNCIQLVRASRGRGLVFLSGATEPLHGRNYVDILGVMRELGLKNSNSKDGFFANAEAALVSGRLRNRSHKQTVAVGSGGKTATEMLIGEPAKRSADSEGGSRKKRPKPETQTKRAEVASQTNRL